MLNLGAVFIDPGYSRQSVFAVPDQEKFESQICVCKIKGFVVSKASVYRKWIFPANHTGSQGVSSSSGIN
jgi:hypothetical protein